MPNFKSPLLKTSLAIIPLATSTVAMAHPNHAITTTFSQALNSGLLHPFTGADHMVLAIGMGMLMYRSRQSLLGLGSLTMGLMAGFGLAVTGVLSTALENLVEYGILASVLVVAVSLFSKQAFFKHTTFTMIGLVVLAMFHGMAHGLEVPNNLQAEGFFAGMLISMTALFGLGTGIMVGIKHYFGENTWVQRSLAVLGLVAVALN